jgi:hypothetical protein
VSGGSREWNWRETGTQHVPGIQPADVRELLDYGAKVVVLSRGMAECLRVPHETLDFLKERGDRNAILADDSGGGALQPACKRRACRGGVSHDLLKTAVMSKQEARRRHRPPPTCGLLSFST